MIVKDKDLFPRCMQPGCGTLVWYPSRPGSAAPRKAFRKPELWNIAFLSFLILVKLALYLNRRFIITPTIQTQRLLIMSGVQIYQLGIESLFNQLSPQEKRYSHHLARCANITPFMPDQPNLHSCRAAWSGTRIILRQVSPESLPIFNFILDLHSHCHGDWQSLCEDDGIPEDELNGFLEYAATFLSNVGNYFVKLSVMKCCRYKLN